VVVVEARVDPAEKPQERDALKVWRTDWGDRPETVPPNRSAKASASFSAPNAASTIPASLWIEHLNISSSKLATSSHALISSILGMISPVGRRTFTVSMGFLLAAGPVVWG
jgi:hypothetical protein